MQSRGTRLGALASGKNIPELGRRASLRGRHLKKLSKEEGIGEKGIRGEEKNALSKKTQSR